MTEIRRLSEDTKLAILAEYAAGEKTAKIAARYGVASTYPSNLAARRDLPMRWSMQRRREWSQQVSGR